MGTGDWGMGNWAWGIGQTGHRILKSNLPSLPCLPCLPVPIP
ncbi:hypothetical protein [Nostoc sp. CMAA1605]|nr:hypothetical protein [Nostoc sp. CMAA1605]